MTTAPDAGRDAVTVVADLVDAGVLPAEAVAVDESLGPWTTYRVGGPAAVTVVVPDEAALVALAVATAVAGVEVLVVGNGSNLLVAGTGFPGVAVRLGPGFDTVTVEGTTVTAGGAALLPQVARRTAAAGLTGFEWAVGVPGSVGGAVRMNAGGHGSDMAASLSGVRVVDCGTGHHGPVRAADLDLGYRRSAIGASQVVTEATLALRVDEAGTAATTIGEIVAWRRANQPGGHNAGSVFTNPDGPDGPTSAGLLIDRAGGKGLRVGTAAVSDKHANFIQADDDGTPEDVFAVMVAVSDLVADVHGIRLHPETRLVGFPPGPWDAP